MPKPVTNPKRREFLKSAIGAGAAFAAPQVVPAVVLGRGDVVAPSEQVTLGGIGIGARGSYDLRCFLDQPDVRFVATCDVRASRRRVVSQMVTPHADTYRDLRDLLARDDIDAVLITTRVNWHAPASILAARAGKDVYCEKPCTKNIAESLALAETFRRTGRIYQAGTQRRSIPHFQFAAHLAQTGKLGKLRSVHAHPLLEGLQMSGWGKPEPEPPKEEFDWDLYLGPAPWRPYTREFTGRTVGFVGDGVLPWGSHTIDLCQWANNADDTAPVEYHPVQDGRATALYANGVELVARSDGWLGLGSCPVRFEGDEGWVEAGDSGKLALSSPALLAGRKVAEIGGYPATFHIRNFLNCVKTRSQPPANARVACQSHIACHGLNNAIFLGRSLRYDPATNEYIGDEQANRLRGQALRAPWRIYASGCH